MDRKGKVKCLFCDAKVDWTFSTRVGKKQICNECMARLIQMLKFHGINKEEDS